MRAAPGLVVMEHVALVGAVLALLAVLQFTAQLSVQGMIKGAADQMHAEGDTRDLQEEGLSYEAGDRQTFGPGSVLTRQAATQTTAASWMQTIERTGGIRQQDTEANHSRTTGAMTKGSKQNVASYTEVVADVEDKPKP
jgi:hypothetical protein